MNLREKLLKIIIIGLVLFFNSMSHAFTQNLVKNHDFETGTIVAPWIVWTDVAGSTVTIDSDVVYSGNYSSKLTGTSILLSQPVSLEPNTTYTIGISAKCESGEDVYFGVENYNYSGNFSKMISDTEFKKYSWTFTTDNSPGNDPSIFVWKPNGTGSVWADSIVLVKDTSSNQPKPPGGFNTYYVSPLGNDSNTGTSPENAWKTINKVNAIDFGPTDVILFEGGKTFIGTIVLDANDYGTIAGKVSIGSYGTGRATINAQGGSGLIAYDCSYLDISNLNFTGSGRLYGNSGNGVIFSYCSNVSINNVEISGFQHSGLKICNMGENFNVSNIYSHDNGYAGIYVHGINKTSLTNIYLGYCSAINNPGDPTIVDNHSGNGIYVYHAGNVTIEYCRASDNGWDMPFIGNGPGGIWVAEADNVLIQHCISHDNKTSAGSMDGLGFDLDGGTTNSTIQYCLSYNNHGAGYGIFQYPNASNWFNNTIRYCVSENDGNVSAPGSVYVWNGTGNAGKFSGLEFYNNVIYNTQGPAVSFLDHKNSNFNFRNNIFVSAQKSVHNGITVENFQGNCWYSMSGDFIIGSPPAVDFNTWAANNNQEMLNGEIVGMFADPMLKNPGNSSLTDPLLLPDIDDYTVLPGSPVINAGLDLEFEFGINPGMHDYFGNLLKYGPEFDIGVHEYTPLNWKNQYINLSAGWNIISFWVVPEDSDFLHIVQPLINEGKLKKVMDETGNTIEDWGTFGGWRNDIGNVNNSEGYKINVNADATLHLDGFAVVLAYEIPLNAGWNIISWPSEFEQDGMDVFQELINLGQLKKVMDEDGKTIEDWGSFGGWKNGIGNFKPGNGYKVNVTDNCILTVYENNLKSSEIALQVLKSDHFKPDYVGKGTDHMNINIVNLLDSGIKEGDEIGIFDGNICVGSAKVVNQFSGADNNVVSIPVSASDEIKDKNGFTDGNPISLKLFKEGIEYPLNIKSTDNIKIVFKRGSSLFAQVDLLTGQPEVLAENQNEILCYPNPFNDELSISINLTGNSEVTIEIYSQMGSRIKTIQEKMQFSSGKHVFKWDGSDGKNQKVSGGIYHLRIGINDLVYHQKIISTH